MGMVMYLKRASAADIARLEAAPAGVEGFVFGDATDAAPPADLIDFDKAWQALHFMLTGEPYGLGHPLGIIADETPLLSSDGPGSLDYSIVPPERMAAFDAALRTIDDATLNARFDPAAMRAADVYLADAFVDEDRDLALDYILQGLPALRRFATACAAAGDGAIRVLA